MIEELKQIVANPGVIVDVMQTAFDGLARAFLSDPENAKLERNRPGFDLKAVARVDFDNGQSIFLTLTLSHNDPNHELDELVEDGIARDMPIEVDPPEPPLKSN